MMTMVNPAIRFTAILFSLLASAVPTTHAASDTADEPWKPQRGIPQAVAAGHWRARAEGVTCRTHAGRKLPEPVMIPAEPWESQRIYVYGTVIHDLESGEFRMWYMSAGEELAGPVRDPRLAHRAKDLVLYATSEDGVHWTRPNLGLYAFNGSTANNIVYDYHSPSVVLDTGATPPGERFKMLGRGDFNGQSAYIMAHSPDGLRWTDYPWNPVAAGGDTCTLSLDPSSGELLVFHKQSVEHRGNKRRLVFLTASRDMSTWSEPVLVMAPDEADDARAVQEGGRYSQFYNMSAFPYAGQWLGMVTHFRFMGPPSEKGPSQSNDDGPIDVQLVHSRDGKEWERFDDRSPVIENGPYPYDAGCILGVANQPVIAGDEVWTYYTAINTTHGGYLPMKKCTIARAAWRLEGFVSLDAGDEEGVVETVRFTAPGTELFINAEAEGGRVAVEVLDEAGTPLAGFSRAESSPLTGNGVRQRVRWREREGLPQETPIRVRFHMRNASLYSLVIN